MLSAGVRFWCHIFLRVIVPVYTTNGKDQAVSFAWEKHSVYSAERRATRRLFLRPLV